MAFARVQVDDSSEAVIDAYCRYERGQRGLAELTVSKAGTPPASFWLGGPRRAARRSKTWSRSSSRSSCCTKRGD